MTDFAPAGDVQMTLRNPEMSSSNPQIKVGCGNFLNITVHSADCSNKGGRTHQQSSKFCSELPAHRSLHSSLSWSTAWILDFATHPMNMTHNSLHENISWSLVIPLSARCFQYQDSREVNRHWSRYLWWEMDDSDESLQIYPDGNGKLDLTNRAWTSLSPLIWSFHASLVILGEEVAHYRFISTYIKSQSRQYRISLDRSCCPRALLIILPVFRFSWQIFRATTWMNYQSKSATWHSSSKRNLFSFDWIKKSLYHYSHVITKLSRTPSILFLLRRQGSCKFHSTSWRGFPLASASWSGCDVSFWIIIDWSISPMK